MNDVYVIGKKWPEMIVQTPFISQFWIESVKTYNLKISIKLNLRSGGGPLWVSGCSLCGAKVDLLVQWQTFCNMLKRKLDSLFVRL